MIVVGVTGGLGTGKSTVARMFGELGAVVIDADKVAHEVMEPKRLAWRKIVKAFGEEFLNEDETINRTHLATLVFRDPEARRQLEAIVHPQVIKRIKQQLSRLKRNRRVQAVVLDVPLLVETGHEALVDTLVVVTALPEVARMRLINRGLSEETWRKRSAVQIDLAAKAALADYVLDNSDGVEETQRQVKRLWNQLVGIKHRRSG